MRSFFAATLWVIWSGLAVPAAGQALTERTPNLDDAWTGPAGVLHFHFMHRFHVSPTPDHKVSNSPTFLLGAGLPLDLLVGVRYATSSPLVNARPNEWEPFARWSPLRQEAGSPLDVGAEVTWNSTAGSLDGELTLARRVGPARLIAAGRLLSAYADSSSRVAVAGGAVLRLHRFVSIAADAATPLDLWAGEDVAWSAGLQLTIPYTPHSLSLHVSNTVTTTLQGTTVGRDERRWGFEFTVPFTLARFTHGFGSSGTSAPPPAGLPAVAGDTVVVDMDNALRFLPDTLRVTRGTIVVWRNGSDVMHTVTADPERAVRSGSARLPPGAEPFDSGPLEPGGRFARRFDVPGEYLYFCVPHELAGMTGVLVVE